MQRSRMASCVQEIRAINARLRVLDEDDYIEIAWSRLIKERAMDELAALCVHGRIVAAAGTSAYGELRICADCGRSEEGTGRDNILPARPAVRVTLEEFLRIEARVLRRLGVTPDLAAYLPLTDMKSSVSQSFPLDSM